MENEEAIFPIRGTILFSPCPNDIPRASVSQPLVGGFRKRRRALSGGRTARGRRGEAWLASEGGALGQDKFRKFPSSLSLFSPFALGILLRLLPFLSPVCVAHF